MEKREERSLLKNNGVGSMWGYALKESSEGKQRVSREIYMKKVKIMIDYIKCILTF